MKTLSDNIKFLIVSIITIIVMIVVVKIAFYVVKIITAGFLFGFGVVAIVLFFVVLFVIVSKHSK